MRWADFGPTPGSRPSSSMSSWTGPAYTPRPPASLTEQAAEAAEIEATHRLLRQGLGPAHGVMDGGEDEILEHLDVVGVDRGGIDRHRLELHGAGHPHLDGAAARLALDDLLGRRRLGLHDLLLHLLRLLEQIVHVGLLRHAV